MSLELLQNQSSELEEMKTKHKIAIAQYVIWYLQENLFSFAQINRKYKLDYIQDLELKILKAMELSNSENLLQQQHLHNKILAQTIASIQLYFEEFIIEIMANTPKSEHQTICQMAGYEIYAKLELIDYANAKKLIDCLLNFINKYNRYIIKDRNMVSYDIVKKIEGISHVLEMNHSLIVKYEHKIKNAYAIRQKFIHNVMHEIHLIFEDSKKVYVNNDIALAQFNFENICRLIDTPKIVVHHKQFSTIKTTVPA